MGILTEISNNESLTPDRLRDCKICPPQVGKVDIEAVER